MDLGCRGLYSVCWCRLKSTRNWIPLGLIADSECGLSTVLNEVVIACHEVFGILERCEVESRLNEISEQQCSMKFVPHAMMS